jgi:competence protein ComEC
MKINFYDVEHGSCTHIITPNGKHILVDIGSKADKSIVSHIKNKYFQGVYNAQINELIITHPHEDHIYDLPALCKKLKPKILHRPKGAFDIIPSQDTPLHKEIAKCANDTNKDYNLPVAPESNPLDKANNGGVEIEIITPPSSETTKDDLNTFSNIIIIKYLGYKFVLTGDNPKSILQNMMDSNKDDIKQKIADATVLLAPHHGRTGEFCEDFFKCVNPILTVVSDKSIVHATQEETSSVYKGRGANLYKQDRYVLTTRNDGTITFKVQSEDSCTVSLNEEGY